MEEMDLNELARSAVEAQWLDAPRADQAVKALQRCYVTRLAHLRPLTVLSIRFYVYFGGVILIEGHRRRFFDDFLEHDLRPLQAPFYSFQNFPSYTLLV